MPWERLPPAQRLGDNTHAQYRADVINDPDTARMSSVSRAACAPRHRGECAIDQRSWNLTKPLECFHEFRD